MGHWSTYSRRGGGASPPSGPTQIINRVLPLPNIILLFYSADVDAADFNETNFMTNPSSFQPDTISQGVANELELDFTPDIDTEASITYTGTAPNVLTPQTFP